MLKKTRKIIYPTNVFDASLERMRNIFDEFENVVVGFSGGKDSTVTLEIALIVAREKNRLPLKVLFLDQESERSGTIEYVREVMSRPEVDPMWMQIPFTLYNSLSYTDNRLRCRDETPGVEWIREKEDISIKKNVFGTNRFVDLFSKIATHYYKGKKFCYLAGVRCEESPRRYMGLTQRATYKWITRGKRLDEKDHYTFYPLYDRTYIDIRKAIHDNGRKYNNVYDYQYRYWTKVQEMRVSSLIHSTAVTALFYLPEVDKILYEKLCKRLPWISTANRMKWSDFVPKKLPFMFSTWVEYRDYLLEHLVTEETAKKNLKKYIGKHDTLLKDFPYMKEKIAKQHISSIIVNDLDVTKMKSIDAGFLNKFLKEQGKR